MSGQHTSAPKRVVACPACSRPAAFDESNRFRPFCSERCRLTDLGGWASESYRIPSKEGDNEDDGAAGGGRVP